MSIAAVKLLVACVIIILLASDICKNCCGQIIKWPGKMFNLSVIFASIAAVKLLVACVIIILLASDICKNWCGQIIKWPVS